VADAGNPSSRERACRGLAEFRANPKLAYKAETIWDHADSWTVISALRVELIPSYLSSHTYGATRAQQKTVKTQPERLPTATSPEITCRNCAQAESIHSLYRRRHRSASGKVEIGRLFNIFDLPSDSES
jgi:hypothetical protein